MKNNLTVPRFFVFTGGPGAGKSTVLEALNHKYKVISESRREVIKEQVANGSDALPWLDKHLFRDQMIARDIEKYHEANDDKSLVLFDRGILDSIGYSKLENISIPTDLKDQLKLFPYQNKVFIFPPWKQIYINDEERKQSFDEAKRTYEAIKYIYAEYGYSLIEVPTGTIKERVEFIENHLL